MKRLKEAGIQMNAQIVCIPEVNDGEELKRTITDLYSLYPEVNNVAVVPIGITKFREGLTKVKTFTKETSKVTIDMIAIMQKKFYKEVNEPFVRLSDEFYLVANQDVPTEEFYNGYEQIEDGVGVTRCFRDTIERNLKNLNVDSKGSYTMVTGTLAYDEVLKARDRICEKNPNIHIDVFKIINNYFGDTITVTGLLTGKDIIEQLKGKIRTPYLFMSDNMFRRGYELAPEKAIMLDDMTISDIEKELDVKVITCDFSGEDLIELINRYNKEE
jgi:NifB/MoaA-like Fe-S oxidoreductase